MRTLKTILLITAICAVAGVAEAQRLEWAVDFSTVFDNREGDHTYTASKTFFQTQLAPEIGLSMLNGTHRIMGGVVWTQPIGAEWDGYKLSPTLYYQFGDRRNPWGFAMGMFPRTLLHTPLPNYIWNDSVYYCQHNVRGAMVQYAGHDGWAELVVDWRGMQSRTRREAFNIIGHGQWQRPGSMVFAGGVVMLNHYALHQDAGDDEHIVDNIIVNPYVGLDLGARTGLDSLTVKAGPLMGIVRNRAYDKWKAPTGLWLEAFARWRWLGVRQTVYAGGRLFPYYQEHGAALDQGEPYLQSKYYARTDVYGFILSNWFMDLRAALDFNFAEHNFNFYQRLILRVYVDASSLRGKNAGRRPISSFY